MTLGRRLAVPPLPVWGACREEAWQDEELESQGGDKEHEGSDHPRSVTAPTAQDVCPFPGHQMEEQDPCAERS